MVSRKWPARQRRGGPGDPRVPAPLRLVANLLPLEQYTALWAGSPNSSPINRSVLLIAIMESLYVRPKERCRTYNTHPSFFRLENVLLQTQESMHSLGNRMSPAHLPPLFLVIAFNCSQPSGFQAHTKAVPCEDVGEAYGWQATTHVPPPSASESATHSGAVAKTWITEKELGAFVVLHPA